MKTRITEDQWISQNNSDHLRAKETIQEMLSSCYLNIYLNEQGVYDKNFTTMNDDDYVEYVALLEKLHRSKVK